MESQKIPNNQSNFDKKEQSWKHHTVDFKVYCEAIVIKKEVWYYQKMRHINQ